MSAINPFSGYVAQGSQIERAQAADKTRQARREQVLTKNVAARDDQLEHTVESADAIAPVHDDQQQQQQNPSRQHRHPNQHLPPEGEEPPHLDITA